ncbi:DNA polymerase I [Apibacter muscae]|uniref:DNA polymerase I n=1 Tax=Apibacter muscae TaxID=2509004 RepID=UPI0011ABED0B|nr:DNA polymerase I [Apibacter muscae]TWP23409.1 DNA polymerase I [Apibacter muscae]
MTTQNCDKKLFLLDAYALIFRAYYAFIKNPRVNSKGINTSAIFGFINTLFDLMKREKPTHLAVVFDVGETFRHKEYAEYKANREETPEAIRIAVPYIQKILEALEIPCMWKEGFEADDVIGTLAKKAEKEGYTTYMMTSDKDYAQLVSEKIFVYKPATRGNDIEIWDIEKVKEKFEVEEPVQVIDFLGMMGDSVDNIPGIPGVGEKTAKQFIKEYGSMENLFAHASELKGKMKEKIEANQEIGLLSKRLATIETEVPIEFHYENFTVDKPNEEKVVELFEELEFRNMIVNFKKTYNLISDKEIASGSSNKKNSDSAQTSLFDSVQEDNANIEESDHWKTLENTEHFYQLVDTPTVIKLLNQKLLKQKVVCFDTETTSTNSLEAELVGISFSYEKGKGYYIPLDPDDKQKTNEILDVLLSFFNSEEIVKVGQNLKYDCKVLRRYNVEVKGTLFDTMIAHYLINPDGRHGMDIMAETLLQYKPLSIETLIGKKGKNQKLFSTVPLEQQKEYAVEDSDITLQLKEKLQPQLEQDNLKKLFEEIEMPLMKVLADMEWEGINLDLHALKEMSKELDTNLSHLEKEIYTQAGEEFNINSPKQLGDIIFDKLKLGNKPKKTKTGQYATGEDVLLKLAHKHKIIDQLLEYRQLQKLKNTYVDALPNEVNPQTGRVHTTFAQTVAATGRLASNNPNLQNIPIRTSRGQEVRKAFVAKDAQHKIISADYSQIELRIIAAMSKDPAMIQSFNEGEDFHRSTAAKVFQVPMGEVSREQRSHAKTVNFGIIYGVSSFGLSEQTGLTRSESKQLIDAYYEAYPLLKQYMMEQVEIARKNGYVETLLGRRRYLPDIQSANSIVRSHAERNAVNAPIQGTAADIIKIAMIQIHQQMIEKKMHTKLLLQVHDELVFDSPDEEIEEASSLIKNTMEAAIQIEVPLLVEVGVGKNWLEAH